MLGKSTPETSDEGHSGSNPLSGDPQIERSNWLPFYRPYSFASQPFDCFAEDIQFSGIFLIGKNCIGMKKGAVFAFHPAKTTPRNSKWSLGDSHLQEAAGCHFTGPIALRHSLSTALPRIFSFPEPSCSGIILPYSRSPVKRFGKIFSSFFRFPLRSVRFTPDYLYKIEKGKLLPRTDLPREKTFLSKLLRDICFQKDKFCAIFSRFISFCEGLSSLFLLF